MTLYDLKKVNAHWLAAVHFFKVISSAWGMSLEGDLEWSCPNQRCKVGLHVLLAIKGSMSLGGFRVTKDKSYVQV